MLSGVGSFFAPGFLPPRLKGLYVDRDVRESGGCLEVRDARRASAAALHIPRPVLLAPATSPPGGLRFTK